LVLKILAAVVALAAVALPLHVAASDEAQRRQQAQDGARGAVASRDGGRVLSASGGAPGIIRGRLIVRDATDPAPRRPDVAALGGGAPRSLADLGRGVVYLESAPRGAFEDRTPERAVMDQRNETFVPHVLAVMVGTIVDFPNSDEIFHNVFSLSKPKRFDLGRYAAGRSKSVRFDRPGIVRVFCDIHSHMNAFILVFSHPFFAVTEDDGRFRIGNVPAGSYTLIGWYEGEARTSRPVTVPEGGIVDVELAVP
jgi:plastocyanin